MDHSPGLSRVGCRDAMELTKTDRVHFIGVGGISMSGLAHALAVQGFRVSGSDRSDSERLAVLRRAGVQVAVGHDAANVAAAEVVIWTTAIREDNPERAAAVAAGLRLHHRSELLAWMLRGKQAIAVTGTHGKTTMTAMLGTILVHAGCDPTVFVGGDVLAWGSNYRLGKGPHVVFEADESDGSFSRYRGCSQVISCLEPDHLDQHGTVERLEQVFAAFMAQAAPEGFLVWGRDCGRLAGLVAHSSAGHKISCGLHPASEFRATNLAYDGLHTRFELLKGGGPPLPVHLAVPGQHNALNALAAIAAAEASGVSLDRCIEAIATFAGTGRRFELLGTTDDLAVYDDYAHHPTEVRATLAAARQQGYQRVVAIFQPHLYSRTRDLMTDFAAAFRDADVVVIAAIYAAREEPIPGVSAEELAWRIRGLEPGKSVHYAETKQEALDFVLRLACAGDLILSIGAGDVREVGEALASRLCKGELEAR